MARQYFTRKFKPSIPANLQVAAFAVGDVVFDWQSFTLPNGVNKLTGATVIAPPNASAASQDCPYYNDLIGAVKIDATDFTDIEPRSIGVTGVAQGGMNPVIFDNYDDSADSYGDNTFYMAAFSAGTPTIGGGINIAGGGSPVAAGSSATVTVEAQDARAFFAPGDVIHGAGNEILGTVSTVTNGTTIVLTTTTVAELADDLDLYNFNPIQIILSFERP